MYQIFVTYTFDSKEKRDGFYADLDKNQIAETCSREKGCIRYEYFYPCKDETRLFLVELWESGEDQQVHTKQPHFALIGELKGKYDARSELEIMNTEKL